VVPGIVEAAHGRPAAGEVAVFDHHTESEKSDVDDERSADQVAIDSVTASAPSGFNFNHDTKVIVNRVNARAAAFR
jgi:hypothetical protein